jgi:hypothetical protein
MDGGLQALGLGPRVLVGPHPKISDVIPNRRRRRVTCFRMLDSRHSINEDESLKPPL